MSDEFAKSLASSEPAKSVDSPQGCKILIEMSPTGDIAFKLTPGMTKVTVYGLLEMARSQFDKMCLMAEAQQAKEQVQASCGGIPGLLKRMNGGRG